MAVLRLVVLLSVGIPESTECEVDDAVSAGIFVLSEVVEPSSLEVVFVVSS